MLLLVDLLRASEGNDYSNAGCASACAALSGSKWKGITENNF